MLVAQDPPPTVSGPAPTSVWRWVGVWAALVGLLTTWLVAGASPEPPSAPSRSTASSTGADTGSPEGLVRRIRGRVLLEDEAELTRDEARRFADGSEGTTLAPAPAGACTIRAWRDGGLVGDAATCASEGGFTLELRPLEAGPIVVELSVPGRLRGTLDVALADESEVSLPPVALGLGYEVTGQVLDGSGSPLAHAEVIARPKPDYGEREPWRAVSDADGRFRFDTLPVGPVVLRGSAPGHESSVVEAVAPEAGVVLMLPSLVSIAGRVELPPDLAWSDVTELGVFLEGSAVWPPRRESVASPGQFVFAGVPAGVYAVEASARTADGRWFAAAPVRDVSGEHPVELGLAPAHRARVRVVDPSGEPVVGARVSLGDAAVGVFGRRGETGSDGEVHLGPLVPGAYSLRVFSDRHLSPAPVAVDVIDANVALEVALVRPARIEGTVSDVAGRPVRGAEIVVDGEGGFDAGQHEAQRQVFRLARRHASGSLGVTAGVIPPVQGGPEPGMDTGAVSDAAGRFVIDLLPGGRYRLSARHDDYAEGDSVEIRIAPSQVRRGVELRLGDGVPIGGRVQSSNAQALANVRVEVGAVTVWTDERGVFDAGLWRGPQTLQISKNGYAPQRIAVRAVAPGVEVDVVLQAAAGRLHGRAVDRNAQPIADVAVSLAMGDGVSATRGGHSDARGMFEFDRLPAGAAQLRLSHAEYLARTFDVEVGDGDRLREYELRRAYSVDVLVRDGAGDPVEHAVISGAANRVQTDRSGRATIGGVPESGSIELQVAPPSGVPSAIVVDRSRSEWVVDLVDGGAIEGAVTDDVGDALVGAVVEVRSSTGRRQRARTRSDGSFRVDGVGVGDVELTITPPRTRSDLGAQTVVTDVRRGLVTRDVWVRLEQE
ncbi:MAG: carboxypeptidase regulatory-like domain-containing protein [Myxococcales bacterium FL481]|nr:MAG: carboxypeptidase regulatory-like domain-containing protein [Myxococcales bacterium FL481]